MEEKTLDWDDMHATNDFTSSDPESAFRAIQRRNDSNYRECAMKISQLTGKHISGEKPWLRKSMIGFDARYLGEKMFSGERPEASGSDVATSRWKGVGSVDVLSTRRNSSSRLTCTQSSIYRVKPICVSSSRRTRCCNVG